MSENIPHSTDCFIPVVTGMRVSYLECRPSPLGRALIEGRAHLPLVPEAAYCNMQVAGAAVIALSKP